MSQPLYLFEASIYTARRKELMNTINDGLIIMLGHEHSPINYHDNYYPFRQDSNFLYYAGLNMPHLAIVLDTQSGNAHLFGNDASIDHIVWMGPQPTMQELGEKIGISNTHPYSRLEEVLNDAQSKNLNIHYLPPYRGEVILKLSKLLGYSNDEVSQKASLSLINAVIAQREIKGEEELVEMEKAVNLSARMHHAVMRVTKEGVKESFLRGIIQQIVVDEECQLAYGGIITINGQTLHNESFHNVLKEGQLLLGDFGASSLMQYAGDITRTVPVSSKFTSQQKEIYQIVLNAENKCIQSLKAGINYRDVHLNAARIIFDGLKDLGLTKGDAETAVEKGAHALFFPHGLGHMIGLDVHDMEDLGENHVGYGAEFTRSTQFGLKSLRLAKTLQEGFVLTVEPGIYFIPELIDRWKADGINADFINFSALDSYRSFGGIRIEDDVLVTSDGYRVLGDPIAKEIDEVEALGSN